MTSTTMLGDWYATYLVLRRRHVVLCCAERTLLPVVVEARELSNFPGRLRRNLDAMLRELGAPAHAIATEIEAMSDVVIAKTSNRSVLGVMNEYVRLGTDRDEDVHALSLVLADTPIHASKSECVWPIKATLELLAQAGDVVH